MICATGAFAQPCVCVDCPQPIPTVSDFQVCYDVGGLSNPTLGANGQAVCGVNLEFTHDYIENLSFTLISPGGQQVQLLGPGVSGVSSITTLGARWNIDLVDCAAAVSPYPGTGPQFSGSNTTWQIFGNYSGAYYPFSGCLSDFNTGTVNGSWCIRVESNAIITNNDRLVNFSVDFCDDSGEACCYAETPTSTSFGLDTILCQGDTALRDGVVFAPQSAADYLNRLLISRNDTIVSYAVDTFDLQTAQPGDYQVCGISYWLGDASSLPVAGTAVSVLTNALATGAFCGEQSIDCRNFTILPAVSTAVIDTSICEGEVLIVGGVVYSVSDSLILSLPSTGGCDSLIDLRLRVLSADTVQLTDSFCEGDTFRIGGVDLLTGGDYTFPFTNQFGCDSLVELELIEHPRFEANRDTAFCAGSGVLIGGVVVSSPGAFRQNLQTVNGCDSIINWNLIELNPTAAILYADSVLTCSLTSIPLLGVTPAVPGGVTLTTAWRGPNATSASSTNWTASESGWYYLDETLSFGGSSCTATDSVFIDQDSLVAGVMLPDTLSLTCLVDTLELSPITLGGGGYIFGWSGPQGTSADSLQIVTMPGRYQVIVERVDNACRDTAVVEVVVNRQVPSLFYLVPDTLTCTVDSVALDASGSLAPNVQIDWQSSAGASLSIVGGVSYANSPGVYQLFVLDTINGCRDSALVTVVNDTSGLQLVLSVSDTLTCSRDSVALMATPDEPITSLHWIGSMGDTLGTTATLNVGDAGSYEAVAVSALTGCRVRTSIIVSIDTIQPTASILFPDTLRCFPPLIVLNASGSSGANAISFLWEYTSTQVIAGSATSNLSTAGGGDYDVIVTDQVNGCADTASVTLIEDRNPPPVNAGLGGQITCSVSTVSLGDPTAPTVGLNFRWTSTSGGLIGFSDGPIATASLEGVYLLTVTDTESGCTARDSAIVTRSQGVPVVQIPDTTLIGCNQQFSTLSGLGSSVGPDFVYAWTTLDGAIDGPSDGIDVRVTSSGTYRLTVTDTVTNCGGFGEAIVIDDCPAFVLVVTPDTINCYTGPRVTLIARGNTGPGTSVAWTARTGLIVDRGNTYTPEVEGGGWYIVEVGQQYTGTTATDSVFVVVDTIAPTASIVSGLTLSCGDVTSCAELDASPSVGLPDMTLTWTTLGGNFCGDTIGPIVRVNAGGIYEVIATNPRNGCVDIASVVVDVEPGVPVPNAGPDQILACEQDSLTLTAILPGQIQNRKWWWVDESGNVLGDTGLTQLTIDTATRFAFVIYDSITGCTAADTMSVIQQACAPNARPMASGTINCLQDTVILSSPPQAEMRFTWIGVDVPFGPVDGDQVQAWLAGEYRLIIQDSLFGLVDTAFVTVVQDTARPTGLIALPQNLTCDRDSVDLDGRASVGTQGEILEYAWISSIVPPVPSTPIVTVGNPGNYALEVTSTINGCKDTAFVQVLIDTLPPQALTTEDGPLNCVKTSVVLDGSTSTGQGALAYEWLGLEGQMPSTTDQSAITVLEGGNYQLTIRDQQNGCVAIDTVFVDQIDGGVVDAGTDQVIDCRRSAATLNGQVNRAGINVQWTSSSQSCIVSPTSLSTEVTCAGEYYLSWTDSLSVCTYYDTVLVAEPNIGFQLEIVGDTVINCLHPILEFQGLSTLPLVTLRWEGIGTDIPLGREVTQPGNLVLIGTDTAGCSDTLMQEVTLDTLQPILSVFDPDTITCARPIVRLQARNSNGRNSIQFRWVSSAIVDTLLGAFVRTTEYGVYTVRATDTLNGCWAEAIVEVAVDSTLPTITLATPSGSELDCDILSVPIVASVMPVNASLTWNVPAGQRINVGANTQDAEVGGIYRVTANHPTTGCPATAVIFIRDNSAPIGSYDLSLSGELGCNVDSVELQATLPQNVVPVWTDALGVPLTSLWVTSPGLYAITLTDTLTGCRSFDSIRVNQYVPAYTLYVTGADTLDCETASLLLTAETSGVVPNGVEYRWVSPRGDTVQRSSRNTYEVGSGGLWTVIAVDPDTGCEQIVRVMIEVSGDAIQELYVETRDASCPSDRDGFIEVIAITGGQAPFTFQLDDGEPQAVGQFGLLEGGRYELLVTDENGCTSTLEVIINQTSPKEVEMPSRIESFLGEELCLGFDLVGGGVPDSIRWSPAGILSCETCANPCLTTLSNLDVRVQIWFGGCLVEASTRIEVVDGANAVWPSAFSPNGDGKNDEWWVLPKGGSLSYCRVYDRWGSIVFYSGSNGQVLDLQWDGTQNGKDVNPAVYVVEVGGVNALGEPFTVYGDLTLIK
ncbi:MAG: gliding motility-associated C-terminal domain-containing protein [Saprospiraceae bacterium]